VVSRSPFNILRRIGPLSSTQPDLEIASDASTTVLASAKARAARIEKFWILSVVGYTVLRFVIAWGAFGDHGANVWIFGFIDIATAVPYAKAVAMVCRRAAAFEWRRLATPVGIALLSFFAPYAYLWFAAGSMPNGVRIGLVVCVSVLAAAALLGVVAKVRRLRRADVINLTTAATPVPDARGDVDEHVDEVGEIVIDLTGAEARVFTRRRIAS
jgi:hypothetical protein